MMLALLQDLTNDEPEEAKSLFFTKLPCEMRVLIYETLETKDLLTLRCVNTKMKDDIDKNLDFTVKIDQSYRYFRRLLKLRIRSCQLRHLTHMGLPDNVFAVPSRMKKLIFDGVISHTNIRRILTQCSSVEDLVFTHETLGIDHLLFKPDIQSCIRDLGQLTQLNLQLLRSSAADAPLKSEGNVDVFLESTFPILKSFKFYFSVWGDWINLFLFLQRHVGTLRDLELQVGDRGDNSESKTRAQLRKISHSALLDVLDQRLLKELRLREFKFRDDVLDLNPTVQNLIFDLVAKQTGLELLHFLSPGCMSGRLLKEVVEANLNSLKEVVVYSLKTQSPVPPNNNNNNNGILAEPDVQFDEPEPEDDEEYVGVVANHVAHLLHHLQDILAPAAIQLHQHQLAQAQPAPRRAESVDMNVFSKCTKLTVLALSCSSSSNNLNQADPVPIRLLNVRALPPSLVRLHLTGFRFNLDEMVYLTQHLPHLTELLLSDSGKMRYSILLTNFLKNCRSLEYINVSPVRIRGASYRIWYEEVEELNRLFRRFLDINYDPIDDMNGFEVRLTAQDKEWIRENVVLSQGSHFPLAPMPDFGLPEPDFEEEIEPEELLLNYL